MIRFFSAVAFLLAAIGANAQQTPEVHPLVIGEIRNLKSNALQEERTLNIYLPPGYDTLSACPVIYLLDGSMNEDFIHITGLVQFFNLTFNMPPAIVVGIANIDRRRDFTFPSTIKEEQEWYKTAGKSAAFISFIEKELQPFIEKKYRVAPFRIIAGHDTTAGFLNFFLIYRFRGSSIYLNIKTERILINKKFSLDRVVH